MLGFQKYDFKNTLLNVHGKLLARTCALIFVIIFDTNYLKIDNG